MERNKTEWNGTKRNGTEQNGTERNRTEALLLYPLSLRRCQIAFQHFLQFPQFLTVTPRAVHAVRQNWFGDFTNASNTDEILETQL